MPLFFWRFEFPVRINNHKGKVMWRKTRCLRIKDHKSKPMRRITNCLRIEDHKEGHTMFMNENEIMKGWTIEGTNDSAILVAKKEIYMPEKKIILLDEANENEIALVSNITNKGGIIL